MSINGNGDTLTITGARLKVSGGVQVSGSIAYTDDATGFGGVSAQIDADNTTLNITAGKTSGVAKIERGTTTNITCINHANVSNNTTIHIALKNTSSNKGDFVMIGTFADDDTVKVNYTDEYVIGPGETGMLTLRKVAGVLSLFIREMCSSNATNTNTKPFYIKDGTNYKYPLYKSSDNGGGNLEGVTINGVQYYRPSSGLKTKTRPPLGIPELIVTPTGNLAIGNSGNLTTINYDVWGVPSSFDFGNIHQGSTKKASFLLENGEASGSFTESGASSGDAYSLYVDKTDTSTSDTLNIDTSGFAGTIAFHHDTFANSGDPYGDGSVATAAANGRFYADTPSYTGDIGTITPAETPSSFVYEFFISVVVGAVSENNELILQEISSTGYSLTSSMMVMNTQYSVGGTTYDAGTSVVGGLFDGSTGQTDRVNVSSGYHDLNQKIFTLTTTQELTNITLVSQRPKYMPGWKIVLNGTTILEDTVNNGTSGTPDPFSITKTLPFNVNTTYTWTPPYDIDGADVLMVAGGGGGAGAFGGGGGAGGLLHYTNQFLSGQKIIVVGNGGLGGKEHVDDEEYGLNGNNTQFTKLTTAIGGGGGGSYCSNTCKPGRVGGSGGGGGHGGVGASGTSGQGYAGGGDGTGGIGGGGGGAGGAGSDPVSYVAGNGGLGLDKSSVFGTVYGDSGWFASGGGGGTRTDGSTETTKVAGSASAGGGTGGTVLSIKADNAQKHTGGGGGSAGWGGEAQSSTRLGGFGGSGIVLVKFIDDVIIGKTIPKVTGASFDSTNVTFTVQGASNITNIKYTINGGSVAETPVGTLSVTHSLSAESITVVAWAVDANGVQISTKKTVTGTIP